MQFVGDPLLLTLGTAVAGTLMIGHEDVDATQSVAPAAPGSEPTAAMIAQWKATASSADYVSTKLPI